MLEIQESERETYSMDIIREPAHKLRFFRCTHGIGVFAEMKYGDADDSKR